eukprot:8550641-Lingulodinium_polyedra.AAC.1
MFWTRERHLHHLICVARCRRLIIAHVTFLSECQFLLPMPQKLPYSVPICVQGSVLGTPASLACVALARCPCGPLELPLSCLFGFHSRHERQVRLNRWERGG